MSPDRPHDGQRPRDTERLSRGEEPSRLAATHARPFAGAGAAWALQSQVAGHATLQRTPLSPLPFRLGRALSCSLPLASSHVSKNHAEIYSDGLVLRVRDAGSRNGTYLNGRLVSDAPLHDGDLLRVGDCDFRLVPELVDDTSPSETLPLRRQASPARVREMLDRAQVAAVFQPIVGLPPGEPVAYEALGRGCCPGLPVAPVPLFELVGAALGADGQRELSRLLRRRAVEIAASCARPPLLFLNTHPAEFEAPGLVESVEELRAIAPAVPLVLEIHESTLGQIGFLSWLVERLAALGVRIAYDDFGAGEARLFELAEVPPHYLKFDRRFVDGIDAAPPSRQRLLASLVAGARELQVATIAEGVERRADAEACARAGFTHAQGFLFGRPAPASELALG